MNHQATHNQPANIATLRRGMYRYGFNGKEVDSEGMGGGSSTYDYGFRIYNAQLGKFLSVDPLVSKFAFYTPYQFAGNKPIVAVDIDGKEDCWTHSWINEDGTSGSITRYSSDDNFALFLSDMMSTMGLKEVPSSGAFVTHQTFNSDGTFTLSTAYTPAVTIDGRGLFEKVFDNMSEGVSRVTAELNSWGDPNNGYELEGLIGSIDLSVGFSLKYQMFEIEARGGIFSESENQLGIFGCVEFNVSMEYSDGGFSFFNFDTPEFTPFAQLRLHSSDLHLNSENGVTNSTETYYGGGMNFGRIGVDFEKTSPVSEGQENSTLTIGSDSPTARAGIVNTTTTYGKKE